MPTLTIYSDNTATRGAGIYSANTSYSSARSGVQAQIRNSDSYLYPGQRFSGTTYTCEMSLISFDTSSLEADWTLDDVEFQVSATVYVYGTTGWILRVQHHEAWNGQDAIDGADWVSVSDAAFNYANLANVTVPSSAQAVTFTNAAVSTWNSAINRSGHTSVFLNSTEWLNNSAPTSNEYIAIIGRNTTFTGRPRLIIDYTPPGFPHLAVDSNGFLYIAEANGDYLIMDGPGYKKVTGTETNGALKIDANGFITVHSD